MIWAIVSSVFVIYLYRKLNATASAETVESVVSQDAIDRELVELDGHLDALERLVKTRRIAP
jgi:hypothetical protein